MATYKFTLTTPDGAVNFGADKIENWADITPAYVVNDKYRGVFREFTSTFNFVSDIRAIIIKAFDKYGYDVDIFLSIYAGNDNAERLSYKQIAYRLRADIQKIEITDLSVSLNFVDSGFVANIMNREDVEVNLELPESGFIKSIDGDSVRAVDKLLWNTHMHDRRLIELSKLKGDEGQSYSAIQADSQLGQINVLSLPIPIRYNSTEGFQSPVPGCTTFWDSIGLFSMLYNSERAGVMTIKGRIKGQINFPFFDGQANWRISLRRFFNENTESELIKDYLASGTPYNAGTDTTWPFLSSVAGTNFKGPIPFDFEVNETVEIDHLNSLALYMSMSTTSTTIQFETDVVIDEESYLDFSFLSLYPVTNADLITPHELFTQILQYYTGQQKPFYSEFFGRKELGYEEDGPGAGVAVATGKMIRGFPYGEGDDTQTYLNTSFEKAFEAYNKIFNLAATIEIIGNEQRLRIEPMSYFRNFEVVADLSNSLKDVSRKIETKKLYSDIEIGYKDREYEELNGLFSFNGEMGLATPLSTDAETLKLTNDWRADDIGIELTRRQQYENDPSKDYRSDEDIFFIDCQIIEEGGSFAGNYFLLPKTDNEYDSVTGIFEPTRVYNLNLSPKRCFYNWQDEIKAGLTFKSDKSLKFIKGPKNAKLVSKKTGEVEIIEAADVEISTLKNPTFIPEIFMIAEAPLTVEEWENIKLNRYGVIAFEHKGVRLYGYISSIEFEINKKTANFELLRANL